MKFKEWTIAITLGLVLGWYFLNPRSDSPPRAETPIQVKPSPDVNVAPEAPRPNPPEKALPSPTAAPVVTVEPVQKADEPKPPPEGHLAFEIREGMAITQGDIVLGKLNEGQPKVEKGITAAKRTKLWESAQIPYSIQPGVTNRAAIEAAIQQFQTQTNVRFVPYNGQADSLVFVKAEELCASYLGRVGGAQPIYLSAKCGSYEVMHELMHALGFVHEHSRPDRDQYIDVVWNNIDPQFWPQFWVIPDDLIHEYVGSVFSFDAQSMMLYDSTAFAKQPGTVTLKAKGNLELQPSKTTFSRVDRERLFYLYGR
ncbi:MAG: M12 family metallopeptidase [Bdellovibrionales bacterium]